MENIKSPLNLSLYETLSDKLDATVKFLEINKIFCHISNSKEYRFSKPIKKLKVFEVQFEFGQSTYIRDFLIEVINIFSKLIDELLEGRKNFNYISDELKNIKETSNKWRQIFDSTNRLKFYNKYHFNVVLSDEAPMTHSSNLKFGDKALSEMDEQFQLRKNFFEELKNISTEKLDEHLFLPELKYKPYKWKGNQAEMEIAELILALQNSGRLGFDESLGATPTKFRKQFYEFFGLSDDGYDQRIQRISVRKAKLPFFLELQDEIIKFSERNKKKKSKK